MQLMPIDHSCIGLLGEGSMSCRSPQSRQDATFERSDPVNSGPAAGLEFETVTNCPYCQAGLATEASVRAEDYFFRQIPGEFYLASCPDCGSLVLSPRLTEACLPLAYASYYTHEAAGSDDVILGARAGGLADWIKRAYVRRRYGGSSQPSDIVGFALHWLARRGVGETDLYYRLAPAAPARILDFGCGGGEYLLRMRRLGHSVVGVDFDPASLERARKSGLEVMSPDKLEASTSQGRFDLITLAHVIEHVADPVALLHMLRSCLRPGGRLYLEAPNAQAAGLALLGRYWRGLEAPRHLSIPSRAGLDAALRASGFLDTQYHVRGSVRSWLWEESLGAMPQAERMQMQHSLSIAPEENAQNCEFLTLTARVSY